MVNQQKMDKQTASDLTNGLQKGDAEAWSRLYETFAESVWLNVARLTGTETNVVGDIVQETFLAAARSARGFDPKRGSLQNWLELM